MLRILIVEDEVIIAHDIKRSLETLGYEVVNMVTTGEDAVSFATSNELDIILMDNMLRGRLNGVEAASLISKVVDTPIIFLSAFADNDLLNRVGEVAPYGYLVKPFRESELNATIKMAVSKYQSELIIKEKNLELEKISQYKTDFLANMSHEIRTPLNAIMGFNKILLDKSIKEGLPKDFISYQRYIQDSGNALMEIINNILDFSKIESGKVDIYLETVQLETLLDSIKHLNENAAKQKDISISISKDDNVPKTIESDAMKLRQVLVNLVQNAIKYSGKGKSITLEVIRIDQNLIFKLTDEGIGISQDKLDRIFDPFEQPHDISKQASEGVGLGLAIARQLVDLLKGTISVTSEINKGTCFTVTIPIIEPVQKSPEPEAYEEIPEEISFSTDNKLVLIEDDPLNQQLIKIYCSDLSLSLDVFDNGGDGIDFILKNQPDLILLDMNLPDMNGQQIITQIKTNSQAKDIPIIVISADAFLQQQQIVLKLGAVDYLSKPIDLDKLKMLFGEFLKKV